MSICICETCERWTDSDKDPGCFIDSTKKGWEVKCKDCRDGNEKYDLVYKPELWPS